MTPMELEDVRTFVALATTRSFSRAAKELFLTQPAVTRRLQRLEQALGATLVDRRRRPLALTAAGDAALEMSQRILDGVESLRATIQGEPREHREFRVGVAHALTEFALTSPVERLRQEYPRVALLLSTGWSRELVRMVRTGHLDAAFVLLPVSDPAPHGVDGVPLALERLVPIMSRKTRTSPRAMRDLEGAEWILNPEGCAAREALLRLLGRKGFRLRVAVETYTYEMQIALVARGRGFGLVPEHLLLRSKHRAGVRPMPLRDLSLRFRVWSLHRRLPLGLSEPMERLEREVKIEVARTRPRV